MGLGLSHPTPGTIINSDSIFSCVYTHTSDVVFYGVTIDGDGYIGNER
jgi:hypothetical protein